MSKFTAGPWHVQAGDSVVHVLAVNQALTATCTKAYYEKFDDEDMANARLIAAAPEMFAALFRAQIVLRQQAIHTDQTTGEPVSPLMREIVAALKKARGE